MAAHEAFPRFSYFIETYQLFSPNSTLCVAIHEIDSPSCKKLFNFKKRNHYNNIWIDWWKLKSVGLIYMIYPSRLSHLTNFIVKYIIFQFVNWFLNLISIRVLKNYNFHKQLLIFIKLLFEEGNVMAVWIYSAKNYLWKALEVIYTRFHYINNYASLKWKRIFIYMESQFQFELYIYLF